MGIITRCKMLAFGPLGRLEAWVWYGRQSRQPLLQLQSLGTWNFSNGFWAAISMKGFR